MDAKAPDLTEQLKQRLFASISAQIDAIGYVPQDIADMVGDFSFDEAALGRSDSASSADTPDRDGLAHRINDFYDSVFYGQGRMLDLLSHETDYKNLGYWNDETETLQQASERLQDRLLDFIPEKTGRILDVACGMGASTRRLLAHYPADSVWAINISERQIQSTRENAPGCHADVMNAVEMTFEDGFFDNIMCIEAAFHFDTRRKFLEDAHRILKEGGRLVMSDVLFTSADRLEQYAVFPGPENHLATVDDYRALLQEIGFRDAVVEDTRREVWGAHFLYIADKAHRAYIEGRINVIQLTEMLWTYYHLDAITGPCLFVCARK